MDNSNRIITGAFFLLLAAGIFLHLRAGLPRELVNESRMLMDTVISIKAWPGNSQAAVDIAFAEFAATEKLASFHLENSELATLNRTGQLTTNASLSELLTISQDYHKQSQGFFDPSFALLQKAYGFYDGQGRLPDDEELHKLLATGCGFEKVLTRNGDKWGLASGSLIDLGGIAGGYAIERARKALLVAGCTAFLIDDAGDIWFEGLKPDGKAWRIMVRDPRDNGALAYVESFEPLAVSTSGDYERFITVAGKNYGHIMNPFTGRPVDYYSSVTIVASTAIAADALSTAVFAMPPEIAFNWVEQQNLAALFLTSSGTVHLSGAGQKFFTSVKMP